MARLSQEAINIRVCLCALSLSKSSILVSLVDGEVEVLRQGMGDTTAFE